MKRKARQLDEQVLELPKEVKFCRKCVVSNQRPRIVFDEDGVCGACRYAEYKENIIDWQARENELEKLLDKHRRNDGYFDVMVPSSGGKDSALVAHQLKERWGMNPLTITWSPFVYTDIGYQNWRNFIYSGFNNILCTPNGAFHRKLSKLAFMTVGDAFAPFSYGQTAFPFHMAIKLGIKLVFFGENGEAEYGGSTEFSELPGMPFDLWRRVYYKGTDFGDLVKEGIAAGVITEKDVRDNFHFYHPPSPEEMQKSGAEFHWYSYYHRWLPQENYYYAHEHTGFEANPDGRSEGTYSKYASLDDRMDGFHYYLMFIKFGIGRATSDSAHEVRDRHLTREEAVALVKRFDGEFPSKHYQEFLEYLDITEDDFWEVIDSWRSPHIWTKVGNDWVLKHAVYYPEDAVEPLP